MDTRIALLLVVASLVLMLAQPAGAHEGQYCIEWNGQTVYCINY